MLTTFAVSLLITSILVLTSISILVIKNKRQLAKVKKNIYSQAIAANKNMLLTNRQGD
jgi:hypothetical protein